MQRDLLRIMRMLAPLQGLVASLVMRTEREAANGHNGISSHSSSLMTATHSSGSLQGGSTPLVPAPAPLISALTVTYLGDVRDHTYTLAETMASLAAECKDLVRGVHCRHTRKTCVQLW